MCQDFYQNDIYSNIFHLSIKLVNSYTSTLLDYRERNDVTKSSESFFYLNEHLFHSMSRNENKCSISLFKKTSIPIGSKQYTWDLSTLIFSSVSIWIHQCLEDRNRWNKHWRSSSGPFLFSLLRSIKMHWSIVDEYSNRLSNDTIIQAHLDLFTNR